ncbi:PorT family protein [Fulvivirga maritima]|uniref:porin family protein n=1 Tax=Fulvivirga maritima TaxID=2904247 RepID=UPI001F29BCFC|nr:porin family protein [Fulvivirga maritima]UII25851.1 PorT family protein [Fulvivirga maritima]
MKRFFTILSLLLVFGASQAQVKFGVQAGANLATITEDYDYGDESDKAFRLAPRVGVYVDFEMADWFALRPGVFYAGKGTSWDYDGVESIDYARTSLHYIEVPVNAVFKAGQVEFYVGPYVAVAISGQDKLKIDGDKVSDDYSFKNSLDEGDYNSDDMYLKATDFGFQLGVGYNFDPIILSATFSKGLSNMIPDVDGIDLGDDKVSNTVLNISVAYTFGQ